ncbi:hypothetical protein SK3146_01657 [Paenibacillus konkukensis]|uniref:Uncharacterized protein n=1 Tax=Paenibacillus konkukensis TaxID=2020716 RepID=A0ABY4RK35_9BACL|nr:hypothetical protein [Paenibacillus konkukensis]UQZ82500.1 hypothetical protein SK3146_01657 [Paenibacillus konkukensis]
MATGVVDVYESEDLKDNQIVLVACGAGLSGELRTIPNGAGLTLKKAAIESKIVVRHESGSECPFSYMEIGPALAKTFGLKNGQRVSLDFSPGTGALLLYPQTVSSSSGLLLAELRKGREGAIVIGYALLSWLGIPEKAAGTAITLTRGAASKKLRLIIPANELDETFRLTPATMRSFGLAPRRKWRLSYNRTTRTLQLSAAAALPKRVKKVKKI